MIQDPEDEAFELLAQQLQSKDAINPDHYKVGGIETIDYMQAKSTPEEFTGHLRLTAIKYLSRAGHKLDALEDFKKAAWYVEKLISVMEKTNAKEKKS